MIREVLYSGLARNAVLHLSNATNPQHWPFGPGHIFDGGNLKTRYETRLQFPRSQNMLPVPIGQPIRWDTADWRFAAHCNQYWLFLGGVKVYEHIYTPETNVRDE